MRILKCDRCGREESPKEDADYVEDWETVTVSTHYRFDICDTCSPALFKFLSPTPHVEPAAAVQAASPE